jgi:HEAT repeat protein
MQSRDAARRLPAARALRRLKPAQAIPTFLHALRDPEPQVREAVTEALIEIGTPVVDGLVLAASSHDATVQHYAAIALGRIGDPSSAAALAGVIVRNRRTTEEYREPLDAARAAAYALHSILRQGAARVSDEGLDQICGVPDVMVEKPSLDDPHLVVAETGIDCSPLRDLARQELSRRQS